MMAAASISACTLLFCVSMYLHILHVSFFSNDHGTYLVTGLITALLASVGSEPEAGSFLLLQVELC